VSPSPDAPSGPTVSGPFSDPNFDKKSDPEGPDKPGGLVQTPAPEGPPQDPSEPADEPREGHDTRLEKLGRYAVEAVQRFAFPLLLALAVVVFLAVQHWLDRKTPKLAYAPVHSRYDQVGFE
jgi:hypothetical protein